MDHATLYGADTVCDGESSSIVQFSSMEIPELYMRAIYKFASKSFPVLQYLECLLNPPSRKMFRHVIIKILACHVLEFLLDFRNPLVLSI